MSRVTKQDMRLDKLKDYTDFMSEAYQWQANRPRFYIDQLMPNSTSDFGVISGRLGLGKTNLALELLVCLATGDPFFGLSVEQIPVVYLDFEGNPMNITERLEKILKRHSLPPDGYLNFQNLKNDRFVLHKNLNRLIDEVEDAKLVLIDGCKHLIEGEYVKPSKIKVFGEDLLKAMHEGNFCSILTWQIKKPHEETLISPGDLFSLKGAADLVEDATFVLLLEKPKPRKEGKEMKYPSDISVNLYFAKTKEARVVVPTEQLEYEHNGCRFLKRARLESNE